MVTNCKLHGRYVQTPSRPCLPRRCCPAAPPGDACASPAALLQKQRARAQATLRPAPARSSVCISHRPAFLGDNCISVCIDAPNSFQLEQTGSNSKNSYLLGAGCSSKHIICSLIYAPEQLGDGRSAYLTGQARGPGMRPAWRGLIDARGPWMCRVFAGSEHPCTFIFGG